MAQRSSRKRRKQRRRAEEAKAGAAHGEREVPAPQEQMSDRYSRSRAKDEAARAALEPLEPGERPTAVTVGAIVAVGLGLANLVALVVKYDSHATNRNAISLLGLLVLAVLAAGMWKARYWAVLGMQTLLAIVLVSSTLALIGAANLAAFALLFAILIPAGTLFWFLVKAMARIQMPERPSRS